MQPDLLAKAFPDKVAPTPAPSVASPAPDNGVDPTIKALASTIGQLETGNPSADAYTKKGASGEYGRYQFMPDTYKALAKKYLGDANAAPTIENQNRLVYSQIESDKAAGLSPAQILSKWNSGNPDAYKQNWRGINSKGVAYDTPAYVLKGSKIYEQKKMETTPLAQANVPSPQLGGPSTFLGDVGNTLSQAGTGVAKAITDTASGQINPLSGLIQGGSAIASGAGGLVNDVLSDTPVVGDIYKGATGLIGKGVSAAANTQTGQGVIADWQKFSQEHPELAADIGGVANIAATVGTADVGAIGKEALQRGVYSAAKEGTLGAGVKGVIDRGAESEAAKILGSAPTKNEVKAAVRSGRLTNSGGVPGIAADAAKQNSIKQVAELVKSGKVSKHALMQDNAMAIKNAADGEAEMMRQQLHQMEVQPILQPEDLQSFEDRIIKRAGTSATNGENPARTLLNVFKEHLPQGKDITAEDILNARQAMSNFVLSNKGDWSVRGVLTGFKSARNAVWSESRDLLKKMAPGVDIAGSLEKQSGLYRALEDIVPNVKNELGSTRLGRFGQRHPVLRGLVKAGGKAAVEGTGIGAAVRMFQQ